MFRLKTWVDKDGELTPKGRKLSRVLVYTYLLCLVLLCWTPQYGLVEGVETPGIQHFLAESADFRTFSLVPQIQVLAKGPFSHVYHVFDD